MNGKEKKGIKKYKRLFQRLTCSVLNVNRECDFLGEDIVVGVSGGLDSLSLYTFLKEYYRIRGYKGRVYGVNVVLGKGSVVPVKIEGIVNIFPDDIDYKTITCSLCSRKRKIELFKFCEQKGVKYIALGHIANDFAENFVWNAMYHKRLESMPLFRNYFNGRFFVVRPFAFVFKEDIVSFAKAKGLKDIQIKCELRNKLRQDVRDFLKKMDSQEVSVYRNLFDIITKNQFYGE